MDKDKIQFLDEVADEIIDRNKEMVHTFYGEKLEDLSYRQLLAAAIFAFEEKQKRF